MNRSRLIPILLILLAIPFAARAQIILPGLQAPTTVMRDSNGIPHIYADSEHDLFFMQGRIHAQDRLFQMDLLRRSANGTVAEVLGVLAVPGDIEARTIGLHRAAELSLAEHSPQMLAILQAYADGVNSFIDEAMQDPVSKLPPEYLGDPLKLRPWEPLDSVLVGKALGAATSLLVPDDINLTIALGTYQGIGAGTGLFDGSSLFFNDLFRNAPFDPASTVPDALNGFKSAAVKSALHGKIERFRSVTRDRAIEHGRDYIRRLRKLPKIPGVLPLEGGDMGGSNTWVVSGQHTPGGRPLLANDMHLPLESPTIFHEVHLQAPGIGVNGSSLPGAPCVVRGHNRSIAWGFTNSRLDITDIYAEVLVNGPSPSGYLTVHEGEFEPVELELEPIYSYAGAGQLKLEQTLEVLIVPRRYHGPLITPPATDDNGITTSLSVQSVGFGPTRDPEGICAINRASNLHEFKDALQLIDFASQNITYADKHGNIGYFITGEVPLREDLQALRPDLVPATPITPPFLIRSGLGGNEWIPLLSRPQNQATSFDILPFDEMPRVINPPSGIIVNANNDQVGNTLDNDPLNDFREGGEGLRYLNWGGRNFSIRAGRITQMINERLNRGDKKRWFRKKISFGYMKKMQADTVMNDARVLTPFILEAWDNATADGAHPLLAGFAADPRLAEAVARLRHWNFTTPTGIPEGYDADPDDDAADASVAATIYSVWRSTILVNTIDHTLDYLAGLAGLDPADVPRPTQREEIVTALRHLLQNDGIGESGLNFTFFKTGIADPAVSRDVVVLLSLVDTLNLLKSDQFAPAFGNSENQDDYRWGRLHRIVFKHPLGSASGLSVPPGAGFFPPPLVGLDGIPTDGGYETIDEAPPSSSNARISDSDSMMFEYGPTGRFVARAGPWRVRAESSLPGGESALPGSPFYLNLLEPWLNNETFRLLTDRGVIEWDALSIDEFVPAGP